MAWLSAIHAERIRQRPAAATDEAFRCRAAGRMATLHRQYVLQRVDRNRAGAADVENHDLLQPADVRGDVGADQRHPAKVGPVAGQDRAAAADDPVRG